MVLQKNNHRPSHPRGIIFDCDGTLADTMPLHWRAWQVITTRHGLRLPEDRFYSLGGVPSRDILRILSTEQGVPIDPLVGDPGMECQLDFGYLGLLTDPVTGQRRKVHA